MAQDQPELSEAREHVIAEIDNDQLKQIVNWAILAVGGILTLKGSIFEDAISDWATLVSLVLIAAGGVCAFMGQAEVIANLKRPKEKQKRNTLEIIRFLAFSLFAAGIGAFIGSTMQDLM